MKFFGWGKSKDPQPQTVLQQASNPDARNGSHGPLDRCKSLSGMGSIMPTKGSSTTGIRKQQGLFGVDEERYLHSSASMPKTSSDDVDSEEKLQDTIRFVFSHEREGLLAIGTFALEQLQSIRDIIDGHQKSSPANDHSLDASAAAAAAALDDMMQSSDDEDQLQRSWVAARKTCDLPVFGDEDSRSDRAIPDYDASKALTLLHANPNSAPNARVKPIVLLTALPPEIRRALDPASALLYGKSFLPHWTDAVPPPIPIVAKPTPDEDYYTSRFCGLLAKKKTPKSKRSSATKDLVPAAGDDKTRIIPIELAHQEAKKSLLKFSSPGVPSLGKLAKLWRATCKQPTARIAPERQPNPIKEQPCGGNGVASGEVFTAPVPVPVLQVMRPSGRLPAGACSPKVAEFRKRVQMHERMANATGVGSSPGHWIKDDEDFLVLEM